jgi:serine/threonine protein kinase/tetratricopeptide (TPR) repeat protein
MRHCFNPACLRPQNAGNSRFCNHCGSSLSLGDRFRGLRNLGRGNQTIFAVDEQLPSRPNCVIQSFQADADGHPYWPADQLLDLEITIGQGQMLPPLMAVLSQSMRQGSQEQPIQFLVQRHVPGESLAQRLLERGPLGEAEVRSLLADLLPQLERLHRADWVHRDIRPETILVAPRPDRPRERAGDPPIAGTGRPPEICRLVGYNAMQYQGAGRPPASKSGPNDASPLIHELERLGYRAPEQLLGQAIPASDLYSLGVTTIQLLTGQRLPHLFDMQNDRWIWQAHLPKPISANLTEIIDRLLTRAIRHRTASAHAVLDALAQGPGSLPAQRSDRPSNLAPANPANPPPTPEPPPIAEQAPNLAPNLAQNLAHTASQSLALALLDQPESLNLQPLLAIVQPHLSPSHRQGSEAIVARLVESLNISLGKGQSRSRLVTTQQTEIELPPIESPSAQAYRDLADFYRDLGGDYPDRLEPLAIAIATYRQLLEQPIDSPLSGTIWGELGQLYSRLSRRADSAPEGLVPRLVPSYGQRCLERAIDCYHHGLDRLNPAESPRAYSDLQRQIGEAHSALARWDGAVQWPAAIAAYQEALAHCSPDHQPQTYSLLNNHLGAAYWHLALIAEPIDNLQAAIQHYSAALVHDDPDRDPLRSGLIQNNLGTAYLNLAHQEQSIDLLRLAIGSFQIALIYRSLELAPEAHRASQNNLGTAYLQLACHPYCDPQTQREALGQSIAAYGIALAGNGSGFDLRQTRINIALAHDQLAQLCDGPMSPSPSSSPENGDRDGITHLEAALQGYLNCLPDWLPHEPTYPMLSQAVARIADQLLRRQPMDHPLFQQIPEGIWSPEPLDLEPSPSPQRSPSPPKPGQRQGQILAATA